MECLFHYILLCIEYMESIAHLLILVDNACGIPLSQQLNQSPAPGYFNEVLC
ncbi:MAG: hypothetical protein ACTHKC_10220 [Candidatus Nitrosocosmicus sp.]